MLLLAQDFISNLDLASRFIFEIQYYLIYNLMSDLLQRRIHWKFRYANDLTMETRNYFSIKYFCSSNCILYLHQLRLHLQFTAVHLQSLSNYCVLKQFCSSYIWLYSFYFGNCLILKIVLINYSPDFQELVNCFDS